MERRSGTSSGALHAICDVAHELCAAIGALAAAHETGAPDIAAAARLEYVRVLAIAASCGSGADSEDPPRERARVHLERLETLLAVSVRQAARRCRLIADDLARRGEWAGDPRAGDGSVCPATAVGLGRRLEAIVAENSS
jgi:hypothetical protein